MVVLTGAVVAVIATGGAAAPAVAGAATGVVSTAAAGGGTAAMVAGAAGAGGVAGAITGSAAAGTGAAAAVTGAVTGAATGAASAAAVTSTSAGAAGIASGVCAGPVGWLVLGAVPQSVSITYDCWKDVLHDQSRKPSDGKLLKDVATDARIKEVTVIAGVNEGLPQLVLKNIWDEQFHIDYVVLPFGQLACHAHKI